VRLFGGPPVPLRLTAPDASRHWSYYEGRPEAWGERDLKLIWEPARFGWVYPLGRAYVLSGEEKYAAGFWKHLEDFLAANPPNQGPNWASAQEVSLRLLALLFAASAFEPSAHSTAERMARLAGVIAAHARRIPPTLSYARAQNNNHRVTEALGLAAAGWALPDHPQAGSWIQAGWRELTRALVSQIHPDGTYAQHSMNYHRLMLQAALQAGLLGLAFPDAVRQRLASAADWLLAQVDPQTGGAPNLGSNDGALILPLSSTPFSDFRPAAQAAARAFLGKPAFPPGPWDEPGLWLGLNSADEPPKPLASPGVHRLGSAESWGTLRAVHFSERPSHADQLHVDLWWQGVNIALDPGTFRYTAEPPWDNTLARTLVHNTIEINGQDQMQRAGRFLWLHWAQASLIQLPKAGDNAITAAHNGYHRLGVAHWRTLKQVGETTWQVTDELLRAPGSRFSASQAMLYDFRLQWLLPDWPWKLDGSTITLERPGGGRIRLEIAPTDSASIEDILLVRAGERLAGREEPPPVLGWFSPTYNRKIPALSFTTHIRAGLPLSILSSWQLR
jgi:hypothetical protein